MVQRNNTTKERTFKHLSVYERGMIGALQKEGRSINQKLIFGRTWFSVMLLHLILQF